MKPSLLITGIRGFLASHLVELLGDSYIIYGLGKKPEVINGITVFSSKDLSNITIKPDVIIMCHAAVSQGDFAPSNEQLFEVNVKLTEQLLKHFNFSKFIYISSVSVYKPTRDVISETSQIEPQSYYAQTKYLAEQLTLNCNGCVIRLSSLFGAGMKENTIIPNYINQGLHNNTIEVWGDGQRTQNYIAVEDACYYIDAVFNQFNRVVNKALLCVASHETSNIELAQVISKYLSVPINFVKTDNSASVAYNNHYTYKTLGLNLKSNLNIQIYNYIKWKLKQF